MTLRVLEVPDKRRWGGPVPTGDRSYRSVVPSLLSDAPQDLVVRTIPVGRQCYGRAGQCELPSARRPAVGSPTAVNLRADPRHLIAPERCLALVRSRRGHQPQQRPPASHCRAHPVSIRDSCGWLPSCSRRGDDCSTSSQRNRNTSALIASRFLEGRGSRGGSRPRLACIAQPWFRG
jgi:hypothetical protein